MDNAINEMKRRFSENDDVLNVVAALDSNSPFLFSTEMLTIFLPYKAEFSLLSSSNVMYNCSSG